MPGIYLLVDRRYGFGFVDELTHFRVVWLSGKQRQYRLAGSQSFPGLSEYSAFKTTWMMLLLLSLLIPINSEIHATTIQNAG